ncbi:Inosose dehydratase [Streptomyces sp. RB17]|uniref:sugar phosphate isomerase/epimerase family protein n=1 Tax=Streptomyces sp. RB17 TaxID=2585197 RepID=UPI00129500F8|nr:sugar phosphate isomerase/epimerase [Streptomyces sp. RB17]MQY39952.1 Inosose dehydratase [Streptomyces sp. RB17]
MNNPIRLGYAINQWKPNFDDFTRPEQHERALKVIAACGFTGVELRAGTGRWDPLGRPASIAATYGSADAFLDLVRGIGLTVSSWYVDPGEPVDEELSRGRSVLDREQHGEIVRALLPFAEFLAAAGGTRLVVRALPAAWTLERPLPHTLIADAAAGWNAVGAAVATTGVRLSLHADCLSAAADEKTLAALLAETDPSLVGLTLDTAELTVAGLDPVRVFDAHHDRIDHLHLKDTRYVDETGERLLPHAEASMLSEGGARGIERWFYECGTIGGLVDFAALAERLRAHDWSGWAVFESEQTPNPSRSTMLNGWYAQRLLPRRHPAAGTAGA